MNDRHLILGVTFWLSATTTGWLALRSELSAQSSSVAVLANDVQHWLTGQNTALHAHSDEDLGVALHDPILLRSGDGTWQQVGVVTNVNGTDSRDPVTADRIEVCIYDDAINAFPDGFELHHHTTPMALDWVVKTMIPEHRQQEIAELISSEWKQQQEEVMSELKPVLREGLQAAFQAVEAELPAILRAHRDEFQSLGDRYEVEIVKAEILPLVRQEILPIVEEEAIPMATEVGKALWNRVSLWSFTWRLLYDKSPLPKRNAVKEEFQRFVNQEALPELRSRSDQFIEMTETIVKRVMENPEVRAVLKRNLKRVAEDAQLHQLVAVLVREALIENRTLRTELEAHLQRQETKAAMKLTGERLEPMIREVGDLIFGTRERGISPEFSRILRSQILMKDRRWFVMEPASKRVLTEGRIVMKAAESSMIFPLAFGGDQQSPLTPADVLE
ncbi:MAG: hypothetical protein R3C59_30750 [Planctomycetaceae bacterium]